MSLLVTGLPWPERELPQTALVVAAHPDDEIIGAGALLTRLPRVTVVHVTDGAPRNGRDAHAAGFAGWAEYAAARRQEAEAALALAGIDAAQVLRLGFPDQQATSHLVPLVERVAHILRDGGFAAVITHAYEGGHPDHDATAFAVHAACHPIGKVVHKRPMLVEMTGYHAADGAFIAGFFLPHDDAGPVTTWRLDDETSALKRRMIDCHATQREVLAPFTVHAERFRLAPRYDFRAPPHAGPLHYERYDWGSDGKSWRARVQEAMKELSLEGNLWL